jgi:hypothetical protein
LDCPGCGVSVRENDYKCAACGRILHPEAIKESSDVISAVIPYKNSSALIAYYLGVFSVIPFLGLPLGVAAFVLGRKGLKFARENPASHGKIHAWIGVVVGGFMTLLWGGLLVFMVIMAVKPH